MPCVVRGVVDRIDRRETRDADEDRSEQERQHAVADGFLLLGNG